jgi:hypothetical protein
MIMKYILTSSMLLVLLISFLFACGNNGETKNEEDKTTVSFALYKQFNEKFPTLSLPYEMLTDNKNYAAFTALLTENHHIDSTFRSVFLLDSLTRQKTDSVPTAYDCCKFYHVGKLYETAAFSAMLYARNDMPPHDDIYIFLATMDKNGKKIDEILFHKPESVLPPTEVNRISSIKPDTTIHVQKLTTDFQLATKEKEKKMMKQTLHSKIYKISPAGKITLLQEEDKDLPMQ